MVNFQRGNDFRQITPYFLVTTGKKRNRGVSSSRIFISSLHHPTCEINDEKRSSPFRASDQFLDFFAYHSSWMDKKFGGGGREGRERLQSSSRNEVFCFLPPDRNEFENNDANRNVFRATRRSSGNTVFTNVTRVHGMGTTRIVNGSTNICGLLANNQTNRICTPCSN